MPPLAANAITCQQDLTEEYGPLRASGISSQNTQQLPLAQPSTDPFAYFVGTGHLEPAGLNQISHRKVRQ